MGEQREVVEEVDQEPLLGGSPLWNKALGV